MRELTIVAVHGEIKPAPEDEAPRDCDITVVATDMKGTRLEFVISDWEEADRLVPTFKRGTLEVSINA